MMAAVDVLIAGAGPAGIAAALPLHRAGLRVAVVDRARFPRDKPCAEYLSPGTLAELAHLGLLAAVDRAGGLPLDGTRVHGPLGSRLTGRFALAGHQPIRDSGLSLRRTRLDAVLVETARREGVMIREGTSVQDLVYRDGGVGGAVLADEGGRSVLHARLVIGADGLRSVVARCLGGQVRGGPRRLALVGHCRGVSGLAGSAEMHVGVREYLGLNPLADGLCNVAIVVPAGEIAAARGRVDQFFRERLARFGSATDRLHDAEAVEPIRVTGPFAVRGRRVVADGALLTGDAAGFFDPFTGEGIGSALRGGRLAAAAALAALDRGGRATARRLHPYAGARRRAFLGQWIVERLIGWAIETPALFDRAMARLEGAGLAHTLVGVTGNFVPPRELLNLRVLATLVR
jgi:flavin-dependent dehydrogenase